MQEKKIFPLNTPEMPGYQEKKISRETLKFPGPAARMTITTQGLQVTESNSYGQLASEKIGIHEYSANRNFGHHLPESDIHPMRLRRLPDYQATSKDYGRHYRHPQQEYSRVLNLRSPGSNPEVSRSNQDLFRAETKLMSE